MLTRRTPISIAQAQAKMASVPLKLTTEEIPVTEANHRILAKPAQAAYDYPHFRRSGVDGYAILAEDDHDFPRDFEVVAEVPAGAVFDKQLQPGQTVRIMTGACVPDEASKVIMIEKTRDKGNDQVTMMATEKHSNITEVGTDFAKGQEVMAAPQEINPGGIAVLTAFGIQTVTVYKQPRIAIIATGTELLAPNAPIEKGKIYNSNGPMLKRLVEETGGVVDEEVQLPDDDDQIQVALEEAIASHEIVITDGGVSVGDYDFIGDAARNADEMLFNKVKQRPGSVTTAFVQDGTLVMALSGNPGACFTGFYLYMEPLIRRYQGMDSRVKKVTGILNAPYTKTNGFDRILRSTYEQKDGTYYVYPNGTDRSGSLANLQTTTCFCTIPHSTEPIALHSEVETWLLPFK